MQTYDVQLTGPQLRVLRTLLTMVANTPDVWIGDFGGRDWNTLGRALDIITEAHVAACHAESVRVI